ncbi:hypothetical protein BLNAU_22737 [Blattamonas nauphoetae]|uniref:Uncharacterized protein n=1 Tax=Blattamonas nauphoetae TaxID=2049346 RepID=A0ABQ9WS73_9EUKA|nr:hypothetical protein BLNAU_22737 [Blattamonas nauphoetae]
MTAIKTSGAVALLCSLSCAASSLRGQERAALSSKCHPRLIPSSIDTRYTAAQIRQHPWYLDNFVGQSIIELVVQEGSEKGEVVIDTEVTVDLAAIPT